MIWLAIWAAGIPVAYFLDNDPTGTRWDRLVGAAVWPLVVLIIAGLLFAGAVWFSFNTLVKRAR